MVVVTIIGILAAVAIPAFMKNARKAKTTEATINVKKISDGAVSYYHGEYNAAGAATVIAHQFPNTPATNPIAPVLGTCCPSKCNPNAALWSDPSWQSLLFSMDDPHYYSYGYVHNNTGASAAPVAALADGTTPMEYYFADAQGDLNCDAVYSTFEMFGAITKDGSVTTGAGLFKNNELE